ncbi:hypothetical protein C8R43DRAFT_891071 [Mycena crocata]|nr:hypothetical protein C8R43DRAFT_891071 [Mycena crocata]
MHLTLNKSTSITGDVISGLREIVEVTRAKTKRKALSMLSSPELVGVYITDAGIVEGKNAGLLSELVAYVKAGGTVVFGGSFKLFVNNKQTDVTVAQLEAFFQRGWGLPWQLGPNRATERKLLSLNTGHKLMGGTPELPVSIGVAGVHLKGVRADTALYLPSGHSQLDIAKFRASNLTETPIAFAEIGKGHLGFIGDSGGDTAITEVLRIMFRLTKSS